MDGEEPVRGRARGDIAPSELAGRVRLADEAPPADALDETTAGGNGWNVPGLLLGLVALAIIIGGLLFIYWGAFRFG